jgi:hypothetical protein
MSRQCGWPPVRHLRSHPERPLPPSPLPLLPLAAAAAIVVAATSRHRVGRHISPPPAASSLKTAQ